jgi:hypothetical protein
LLFSKQSKTNKSKYQIHPTVFEELEMKVAAFVFVFSSSVNSDLFEELRGNETGGMFD